MEDQKQRHGGSAAAGAAAPHVVVLPLPTRGHVNPMLQMARKLAMAGVKVTYINTEFNARHMDFSKLEEEKIKKKKKKKEERSKEEEEDHDDESMAMRRMISFVELPDGLPDSHGRASTDLVEFVQSVLRCMQAPFERLLEGLLLDQSCPPTCVLADTWMVFSLESCRRFCLPHANFWTQSAASFASLLLVSKGYEPPPDPEIPGAPFLKASDMNTFVQCYDHSNFMFQFVIGGFDRLYESQWIFINTFDELERDTIDVLRKEYPSICTVGPLLPISCLHGDTSNSALDSDKSTLWVEEDESIEWLNHFPPKSVLYVAFGSLAIVSIKQIEEIALGLEESGYPFLWAIREDIMFGDTPMFPKGFQERIQGRSKLVSWTAQLKVLSHEAIRGFFTHGGWNSTIEAIALGIPMLGWPYFSDQPMDCKCIEQGWKVGLRLIEYEDEATKLDVSKDVITTKIKELMENKDIHESAKQWSLAARMATLDDGSSFVNIQSFINALKSNT